jgi:hypothetical protein
MPYTPPPRPYSHTSRDLEADDDAMREHYRRITEQLRSTSTPLAAPPVPTSRTEDE